MKHLSIMSGILFLAFSVTMAQQGGSQRIPLIGTKAPSFKSQSTIGKIAFPADFNDKWKILFSHPRDFTPVCSSEILDLAYRQEEFKALNTQILVLSVDKLVYGHPIGDRPLLLLGVMLILVGVQMFTTGLIGQMIVVPRMERLQGVHVTHEFSPVKRNKD